MAHTHGQVVLEAGVCCIVKETDVASSPSDDDTRQTNTATSEQVNYHQPRQGRRSTGAGG